MVEQKGSMRKRDMNFGKTIKIFLLDGEPNGRMTCELSNWTGKAYKIPRTQLKICTDRPDLNNTGVYMLFGRAPDDATKSLVYIGEAEGIYTRLISHLKTKDFWLFDSFRENICA